MHNRLAAIALIVACLATMGSARAEPLLPIFDGHVHYSEGAWSETPPEAALAIMTEAGVPRALVSSTPDDGTLMLHRLAPERVVPFLRPYRGQIGLDNWHRHPDTVPYLKARLAAGVYQGIGEFHLHGEGAADSEGVRAAVALAIEHDIFLHVHADAAPVSAIFTLQPEVKLLWAHAGMSERPATIAALLERHPTLWVELSLRAAEIAPRGALDPEWRALFEQHPGRFVIGSDTFAPWRWREYQEIIAAHRAWLAELPAEIAAAIAHGNATRLFGDGGIEALQ